MAYGAAPDMYDLESTSDFYTSQQLLLSTGGGEDDIMGRMEEAEQHEMDAIVTYSFFCFCMSAFPIALALLVLYSEAVHFRSFAMMLLLRLPGYVHRCLILHPVPFPVVWIIMNYIAFPSALLLLSWSADKTKLETFRQQESLKELNKTLVDRLRVVEKALAFEGPTSEELSVVGAFLQDSGQEFKNISIPFHKLEFQERIGTGGCGEVIKASYRNRTVAVKRLVRSRITQVTMRALVAEVRVLRQLRHPNVVEFVGFSWDNVANVCLVLEYMERGSLTDVLNDRKLRLSWADPRLKMVTDIAAGLVYLHCRPSPVIHRDVKPSNVLVTPTFGCKLADFGASRFMAQETMTQIGTQSYMAPEAIRSGAYDEKVDIYAVGILLAAMETRRAPYYNALLQEHGQQQQQQQQPGMLLARVVLGLRPRLPESMPPQIADLARACWADNPADRPSAVELLSHLNALQNSHQSKHGRSCVVNFRAGDTGGGRVREHEGWRGVKKKGVGEEKEHDAGEQERRLEMALKQPPNIVLRLPHSVTDSCDDGSSSEVS